MIVNALLDFVVWIFSNVILEGIELFDVPETIAIHIAEFIGYLATGCRILAAYTDFEYLLTLLGLSIIVSTFFNAYKVIRWLIRKIPFINIS